MKAFSVNLLFLSGLLLALEPACGQTWTQTSANTNYEWGSIACSADGTKVVASSGDPEGIYLSTNSGATWAICIGQVVAGSLVSSADGTKFAGIEGTSAICTSTNSGGTWTQNQPPSGWGGSLGGLAGRNCLEMSADGNLLLTLVDGGGIYISTNTGASWILATNLDDQWVDCVCSANGTKLAALPLSDPLSVYLSTNSGVTWIKSTSFTGDAGELNWLVSTKDGSKLIIEGSESSYISTNWAQTWQFLDDDGYLEWEGSADLSLAILVDNIDGTIDSSTNLGMTWTSEDVPQAPWHAAACSADGRKLFAAAGSDTTPSTNGIWTLQLPPAPQMHFSSSIGAINLSWLVPSTNMALEESSDLNFWTALTNVPFLNLTNLQEQLTISATNDSEFFRLVSQ